MSGNEGRATHHKEEEESEVTRMMKMRGCDDRVSEVESKRKMRSSGESEDAAGNVTRRVSSSSRGSESVMKVTKETGGGESEARLSERSETGMKVTDVTESRVRSRESEEKITDTYENEVNMRRDKRETNARMMTDMNGSAIGVVTVAGTERKEARLVTGINYVNETRLADVNDDDVNMGEGNKVSDDASDESESGLSEGSDSEVRALKMLTSTVVKELQAAILSPNPNEVRALLDQHPQAINTQPTGDEVST